MYFSGKISNSLIGFLKRCGRNDRRLFELTPLEAGFLQDPHSWMNAREAELFLAAAEKAFPLADTDLVTAAGRNCANLKCWGGLEDFLRLFDSPYEIHEKADVFFSYFVQPGLKISRKKQEADRFSFKTNLNERLYPSVKRYLAAVLEALPLFSGGGLTKVLWENRQVVIYYSEEQKALFPLKGAASFPPGVSFFKRLAHCEKNLKQFKKTGLPHLLDDAISSLSRLRRENKAKDL